MWDLLQFAGALRAAGYSIAHAEQLFAEAKVASLGEKILKTVKARHGDSTKLQSLAQSTQEARNRLGYAPNEPLLREGDKRESYEARMMKDPSGGGHALVIGSTDMKGLWHEFGYYNARVGVYVPARPVLMPSVLEHKDDIQDAFGQAMVGLFEKAMTSSTKRPFYRNRGISRI